MTINRQKVAIILSILGIAVGLGLCGLHLHSRWVRIREERRKHAPLPKTFQVEVVKVLPASTVEKQLKNTFITAQWKHRRVNSVVREFLKAAGIDLSVSSRIDMVTWMASGTVDNVSVNNAIVQLITPLGAKCILDGDGLSLGLMSSRPIDDQVELTLDTDDATDEVQFVR